MQLYPFVDGTDVSSVSIMEETEIRRDSSDAISTARVVFFIDSEYVYGVGRYGEARYVFAPREWQEIQIKDQAGVNQFAGFIASIERKSPPGEMTTFECDCVDYGTLLDRTHVNLTYPAGWTDKNIILDAFSGQAAITVNPANIAHIATLPGDFDAKDISLRELLDRLRELTGGEWRVDYSPARNLYYYVAGSVAAPWVVTDEGNGNHHMDSVTRDSAGLANLILVLGGFDANGAEVSATAKDLTSQGKYTILSATVVDRSIADAEMAGLRAETEIARRAFPRVSGKFSTILDGLDVGQTATILNRPLAINGAFLLRAVTIKQVSKSEGGIEQAGHIYCQYEVEFGQPEPNSVFKLRRLLERPKQPAYTPVARPAAGSIGPGSFASTIAPVNIVNAKPTNWTLYPDNAIFFLTTDRRLYRRSGNDWTRNVSAADIEDQIQAGQLAADSVIAGTIAAGAIRAVDAAFESAAIQNADISFISATKIILGTLDAQLVNVINLNADNITVGNLSGTRLADGSVADIKISSGLSATKMTTGTLNASLVNVVNLNASNITVGEMSGTRLSNGTVQDIKIASGLSATKLTTGTLDASVVNVINLNASNITTGSLSASRISSGTISVGFGVINIQHANGHYLQLVPDGIQCLTSTGGNAVINLYQNTLCFGRVRSVFGFGISGGADGYTGSIPSTFTSITVQGGLVMGYVP